MNNTKVYVASGTCQLSDSNEKFQELLAAFYQAYPAAAVLTVQAHTCFIPPIEGERTPSPSLSVSISLTYNNWDGYWTVCEDIAQEKGNGVTAQQIWDSSTQRELDQFRHDRQRAALPDQASGGGGAIVGSVGLGRSLGRVG